MNTDCVCPVAGWCDRNKRRMIGRLHELCQTNAVYCEAFRDDEKKTSKQNESRIARELAREERDKQLLNIYHALWQELHTKKDATKEWFASWLKRIPSLGCECRNAFEAIMKANPPRFDDWWRWTWEVHNAVNRKLGKPELSWEDSVAIWGWYTLGVL
jgi:hypothetical protein